MICFSYFKEDQAVLSISLCVDCADPFLWDLAYILKNVSVSFVGAYSFLFIKETFSRAHYILQ